jgi:prepilin-type N-terminal cleavage/methylation domain-containing protein
MKRFKGFSLVELIVVITITGVVVAASVPLLNAGLSHYLTARSLVDIASKTDIAMSRMTRELMMAINVTTASSNQIEFVTYDNDVISYRLNLNNIERNENGGTFQLLTNEAQALAFQYFDGSLNSTATRSSIRLVTINMSVSNGSNQMELVETVYPRNMS